MGIRAVAMQHANSRVLPPKHMCGDSEIRIQAFETQYSPVL
jgi:hypothetical protein